MCYANGRHTNTPQLMISKNYLDFYLCPLPSHQLLSCTIRKTLEYWYLTKLYLVITTLSFALPAEQRWIMNHWRILFSTFTQLREIRQLLPKSPVHGTLFPNNLFKSLYSACSFCPFPFSSITLRSIVSPISTNSQPIAFVILFMDVQQGNTKTSCHRSQKHFQNFM